MIFGDVLMNGSSGQTAIPIRTVSKFCAEPQSPFSNISHSNPKTLGKPLNIVSWPKRRPKFPSDGGDSNFPTTLPPGLTPIP